MSNTKKYIEALKDIQEKQGGNAGIRSVLYSVGGVPIIGGPVAALGSVWSEKDQEAINFALTRCVEQTGLDIDRVMTVIEGMLLDSSATETSLVVLLSQIVGDTQAEKLINEKPSSIHLMLSSETRSELEPFVSAGFISIKPTHNTTNLGANNIINGVIEETKRPYGMGSSFIVSIHNFNRGNMIVNVKATNKATVAIVDQDGAKISNVVADDSEVVIKK